MDHHHVLTVASGFGLRVIPYAPFRLSLGPNHSLDVESEASGREHFARLSPEGEGGYASKLAEGTPSLGEVLEVETLGEGPGPQTDHWRLETTLFSARLPEGVKLHSTPEGDPSPFLLVAPPDLVLYCQPAHNAPPLAAMHGPGQSVVAQGPDWVEVGYSHGGESWWQRHSISLTEVVVTVQALQSRRSEGLALLEGFLESFRPNASILHTTPTDTASPGDT